jgi:hypothetical protein
MKFAPLAALLLLSGAPAFADGHAETQNAAPMDATAEALTSTEEAAAAFSIDTPIETLMADEAAKAAVTKHLPGLDAHPAYGQFKTMSLTELMPWSQGLITGELLQSISAELQALV